MPPRRSHKKSRDGCRRCKTRKIKCDEVHPRCGNCEKHGVDCDFELPGYNGGGGGGGATLGSANPSRGGRRSRTTSPTTTTPANMTVPHLYQAPGTMAVSHATPSSSRGRLLELRLMHQYISMTSKTLTVTAPITEEIWRDAVPQIAFAAGSHHLTDGMLAVAALHLRSLCPLDQDVVRASHAYMASSLREYSDLLTRGINAANAEALFLTSTLIAIQSTATRVFTKDESLGSRSRHGGYSLPMSWFHSFQGVKAITAASWLWLRQSSAVIPIINSQPVLQLDLNATEPTFFGHLLDGLDLELAELSPSHGNTSRQPSTTGVGVAGSPEVVPAATHGTTAAAAAVAVAAAAAAAVAQSTPAGDGVESSSHDSNADHNYYTTTNKATSHEDGPRANAGSSADKNRQATRQAYEHAVAVLNWAHKIPHKGSALAFPATVSRRFVELVEERRPRALAILASFFALLKCLDPLWWLRGMARREVLGIVSLFNSDYFGPEIERQWWPHLEWAVRVALHDDKDKPGYVPPDVWGASWPADDPTVTTDDSGPDFVSHIEMVSQMVANGLNSFPAPNS